MICKPFEYITDHTLPAIVQINPLNIPTDHTLPVIAQINPLNIPRIMPFMSLLRSLYTFNSKKT